MDTSPAARRFAAARTTIVVGLSVLGGLKVLLSLAGTPLVRRAFVATVERVDHAYAWHRLPTPLGLLALIAIRTKLRERNLHDTGSDLALPQPSLTIAGERHLTARTADGTFNDLAAPWMGSAGTRFGRNVPLTHTFPDTERMLRPNPRLVSRALLTRDTFQPATSLNVLVAAWLQFMIRDWFSHGKSPQENPWQVPLDAGDRWPENPMRILRTRPDPTRSPAEDAAAQPPTYANVESQWWDGSQIYGSDAATQARVQTGQDGKLKIGPDGLVPVEPNTEKHPADEPGFWAGIGMMHVLFTREHNAICDRLRAEYPSWSDDALFEKARLVNAALLAKIHTVEWTTAILGHPTMQVAMRVNWWGLAGERLSRLVGRLGRSEVVSGIVGGQADHFGVPYSLTEEFVAVYRMHPLIPDDYTFRSVADDRVLRELPFPQLVGRQALALFDQVPMADLFYSFGVAHPGALVLHNFPRGLQFFERQDGFMQDLAATDILRSRELGVPRYNEFRRLLHLRPLANFDELTANEQWRAELRRVYEDDVELLDLTVGMFAEEPPEGFGFSDTALRIFALMASRRLNSDRFFTDDYTAAVYTQTGLDWVADNTMTTVLLRHHPDLAPALHGLTNAFGPWRRVG